MQRNSLLLALGRGGLEHAGGRHEVLDVLAQHLVLRLELQVLFLDLVHPRGEICQKKKNTPKTLTTSPCYVMCFQGAKFLQTAPTL